MAGFECAGLRAKVDGERKPALFGRRAKRDFVGCGSGKGRDFVPSPERVFTTLATTHFPAAQLDVMPDGKEVIEIVDADALTPDTHVRVILNFGDEVRRRLAGGRK